MKMVWKIVLLASVILPPGRLIPQTLSSSPAGTPTRLPVAVKLSNLLRQPLPGSAAPQGAASSYNGDNLYQYIDGGADIYLLYDFKTLLHQNFKSGAADLTVDVYDMGNGDDAFGVYSSERSPKSRFLPIGAEGYRGQGILNFIAGRYYVKLSGSGPNSDALLVQFAQLLSKRIGASRALPALLASLPRQYRIAHSEQYIKKDPLGHAFLAPAYLVTYEEGKQQMKLVVSVASSAGGAKTRAEQLTRHFRQSGQAVSAPELGENGMRGSNSFEGNVMARTAGRYLIAIFNPGQNAAQVLNGAAQNLH